MIDALLEARERERYRWEACGDSASVEREVRACHALILSLLYVNGTISVRHGAIAYADGILDNRPIGDMVRVTKTSNEIKIERLP